MKVLLGIGGSEDSLRALERTVDRAREAGDDLTVAILEGAAADVDPDELERLVGDRAADAGLDVDVRRVTEDPGSELVAIAERESYDEVVLGGGEQSPMGKIEVGTIGEFVLLNSHVTVTLVR